MSEQNSLQVASGDAIEDVTNTPANNKKCSTKSMLLLGTGTVFVVIGIALGAYHAGNDIQKSAANSALDSAKEEIKGMFGDDEEQLAAVEEVGDASAPVEILFFTPGTNVTVTVDAKSGKSASSKSKKKSSGTASPTTDMLSDKAKSSKSGVVTTSSPSTDSLPDVGGSSKSSKSDGGTASPTTDMLSGKSGKVKSSKSLTTSSPTDSLPAGGGFGQQASDAFKIEKDEEEATAEIAFMSLSQAEYSMSMFTRRQYN